MPAGCVVVLTRAIEDNARLREEIGTVAAEVVDYPCIETEGVGVPAEIAATRYTGVIFVSRAAVRHFFDAGQPHAPDEVVAIGRGTAGAVRRDAPEWPAAFTPDRASAEEIVGNVNRFVKTPGPILYVRGDLGDDSIPDAIRATGRRVEVAVVYRTLPAGTQPRPSESRPTAVVFASSSAVDNFVARNPQLKAVDAIAIGPSTAETARRAGFPTEVAQSADIGGLAAAVQTWVARHHIN